MLNNNCRNFFYEIKKGKISNRKLPSTVDNAIGSNNICNIFGKVMSLDIPICNILAICREALL